jgi:hypothetical protein
MLVGAYDLFVTGVESDCSRSASDLPEYPPSRHDGRARSSAGGGMRIPEFYGFSIAPFDMVGSLVSVFGNVSSLQSGDDARVGDHGRGGGGGSST